MYGLPLVVLVCGKKAENEPGAPFPGPQPMGMKPLASVWRGHAPPRSDGISYANRPCLPFTLPLLVASTSALPSPLTSTTLRSNMGPGDLSTTVLVTVDASVQSEAETKPKPPPVKKEQYSTSKLPSPSRSAVSKNTSGAKSPVSSECSGHGSDGPDSGSEAGCSSHSSSPAAEPRMGLVARAVRMSSLPSPLTSTHSARW
mmetsp:Transcript_8573/g.20209  ORF Transcript_8573/g.20209 Transcript_8573/m.20209 type:complete len:201 (-) Transcript_8573:537-1139(-)